MNFNLKTKLIYILVNNKNLHLFSGNSYNRKQIIIKLIRI